MSGDGNERLLILPNNTKRESLISKTERVKKRQVEMRAQQIMLVYEQHKFRETHPGQFVEMWECPFDGTITIEGTKPDPENNGGPVLIAAPQKNQVCRMCEVLRGRYPEVAEWLVRIMNHHELEAHELDDEGNIVP